MHYDSDAITDILQSETTEDKFSTRDSYKTPLLFRSQRRWQQNNRNDLGYEHPLVDNSRMIPRGQIGHEKGEHRHQRRPDIYDLDIFMNDRSTVRARDLSLVLAKDREHYLTWHLKCLKLVDVSWLAGWPLGPGSFLLAANEASSFPSQ